MREYTRRQKIKENTRNNLRLQHSTGKYKKVKVNIKSTG